LLPAVAAVGVAPVGRRPCRQRSPQWAWRQWGGARVAGGRRSGRDAGEAAPWRPAVAAVGMALVGWRPWRRRSPQWAWRRWGDARVGGGCHCGRGAGGATPGSAVVATAGVRHWGGALAAGGHRGGRGAGGAAPVSPAVGGAPPFGAAPTRARAEPPLGRRPGSWRAPRQAGTAASAASTGRGPPVHAGSQWWVYARQLRHRVRGVVNGNAPLPQLGPNGLVQTGGVPGRVRRQPRPYLPGGLVVLQQGPPDHRVGHPRPVHDGVAPPLRPQGPADITRPWRPPLGDVRLPRLVERRDRRVLRADAARGTPDSGTGARHDPPHLGLGGPPPAVPGGRRRGTGGIALGCISVSTCGCRPRPLRCGRRTARRPDVARRDVGPRGRQRRRPGRVPVGGVAPAAAVDRAVPAISGVGRGMPVVGDHYRTAIGRTPVVATTATAVPGRGARIAVPRTVDARATARIAAVRVRHVAGAPTPAASVGRLAVAFAAAAGLAGPAAVMLATRQGVANPARGRGPVALRPLAPSAASAVPTGRAVPSVPAAATVLFPVPATGRIAAPAKTVVPITWAAATTWVGVAITTRRPAGRRVRGARARGGSRPRHAPLVGGREPAPPRVRR